MSEAISRLVPYGSSVALGLALEGLIPFAAGHEIIRQGVCDLTLIGPISDILLGTDTDTRFGVGQNAKELELLVEAGLTPMEALMAGTSVAAEALGLEKDIGTLEEGKLADLLILDKDPLQDITCLQDKENIQLIFKSRQPLT
jgi:hypothetical protein